ncbi:MAG: TlyA family RNA methyltransferase [Actinomycetota bacterium]|nr:TlyA family RNA methyltransferase [Actinomycetota bacterium]
MRRRLDAELVRRGLAESRTQAQGYIDAGRVLVGGAIASKAAHQVSPGDPVVVTGAPRRFVGRGAEKLLGALERFELDPRGVRALDAGASTGGFTDVLLQHGAASVVSLDVGHGQLHERLRADDRVEVLERTNLRHVDPAELGPFGAVVADLSFISLTVVMQVLVDCCADDGWLVLLVKPQFEAGRREASKGRGVIVDPAQWRGALERVTAAAVASGARVDGLCRSPLHGADGNVEFLLLLRPDRGAAEAGRDLTSAGIPVDVEALIDELVPMPVDDDAASETVGR